MEVMVGLEMLQIFNRKRRNTEVIKDQQNHYRKNYKETNQFVSLVA